MILLQTILSVLAVWALLAVLAIGLLLIFKVLDSVRERLRRIAMGVRAIERQTQPLGEQADTLADRLASLAAAVEPAASTLDEVAREAPAAAAALHGR